MISTNALKRASLAILLAALAACSSGPNAEPAATLAKASSAPAWRDTFPVDKRKLSPTGAGTYWKLTPGRTMTYRSADGSTLTITNLRETRVVDGVTTRVVEEREEEKGVLVEVSRNYMAIDPATGDVYYFGEETDMYKGGKVASHDGSWVSGLHNARFGMLICGKAGIGDRFQQENAPGVALDRVEVVGVDETVKVPAGTFTHCIHVVETSSLDKDVTNKWYAPGVGLIKDDEFELTAVQ